MALPKLLEDLAFISKLGDYPGSDNNLTTEQFRSRFDTAALIIQAFLNDQLIPGLDQFVDVQALLNGILDTTLTSSDKAANAKTTGDALNRKLDKAGGNVTGNIDMSGRRVVNMGEPVNAGDATSKSYVDNKHKYFKIVALANNWSGSGPYTQVVALNGILNTDSPHWDVLLSADSATAIAEEEAFSVISKLDTSNGSILLTCLEEKPDINVTIQMEVNR
jgi:hypothetical protein